MNVSSFQLSRRSSRASVLQRLIPTSSRSSRLVHFVCILHLLSIVFSGSQIEGFLVVLESNGSLMQFQLQRLFLRMWSNPASSFPMPGIFSRRKAFSVDFDKVLELSISGHEIPKARMCRHCNDMHVSECRQQWIRLVAWSALNALSLLCKGTAVSRRRWRRTGSIEKETEEERKETSQEKEETCQEKQKSLRKSQGTFDYLLCPVFRIWRTWQKQNCRYKLLLSFFVNTFVTQQSVCTSTISSTVSLMWVTFLGVLSGLSSGKKLVDLWTWATRLGITHLIVFDLTLWSSGEGRCVWDPSPIIFQFGILLLFQEKPVPLIQTGLCVCPVKMATVFVYKGSLSNDIWFWGFMQQKPLCFRPCTYSWPLFCFRDWLMQPSHVGRR